MTPNPNEAREREALIAFLNGSAPERHLRERAVASASQRDSLVEAARNAVDAMASAREMLYVEGCFTTSEEIDAACAALRAVLPKDKP